MNSKEANEIIDKYSKPYAVSLPSPDMYLRASGYLEACTKYRKQMDELVEAAKDHLEVSPCQNRCSPEDMTCTARKLKKVLSSYQAFIEEEGK